MIGFEAKRYEIFCTLIIELNTKKRLGKKRKAEIIGDLELLKGGFIPFKYL